MKFGAPDNIEDLAEMDLSLPPDHAANGNILNGKATLPKVYVGCSVWGQDPWVGDLYPEGTKKKDYLNEYIKRMSCIELNSTFYNVKKASMQSWAEAAKGHDFKFCPKFNRRISHIKRLKDEVFELADYFVEMCNDFGDNLGTTFLQMPENFGPKWFDRLKDFLAHLPKDFPVAVELRHEEWYQGEVFDELFSMLREFNKTAVITDTATKRQIIHQRLTGDQVFIRFAAYDQDPTNLKRMDEWAVRLKEWIDQGVREVFFFSKQEDETYAPRQADYMIRKLNEVADLKLTSPYAI